MTEPITLMALILVGLIAIFPAGGLVFLVFTEKK